MEVTKSLKPSMERAIKWSSEQAGRNESEHRAGLERPKMQEPTWQYFREGRRRLGKKRQKHPAILPG